jgi:hypothetical protein
VLHSRGVEGRGRGGGGRAAEGGGGGAVEGRLEGGSEGGGCGGGGGDGMLILGVDESAMMAARSWGVTRGGAATSGVACSARGGGVCGGADQRGGRDGVAVPRAVPLVMVVVVVVVVAAALVGLSILGASRRGCVGCMRMLAGAEVVRCFARGCLAVDMLRGVHEATVGAASARRVVAVSGTQLLVAVDATWGFAAS